MRIFNILKIFTLKVYQDVGNLVTGEGYQEQQIDNRPFLQDYGFYSWPLENMKGLAISPNGIVEKSYIIKLHDQNLRPKWAKGDTGLYDNRGNYIRLQDGVLKIHAVTDIRIEANGNGNIIIDGDAIIQANNVNVNASGTATIQAPQINLNGEVASSGGSFNIGGANGQPIARVGDQVQIGDSIGTIISGSNVARSI